MPALGESVTEGTVTRWLKQVGDRVEVDEPLLEVSTDKVDTEIPSPIAGVIEEILVAEDETAEVGAPLVRIGSGAGAARRPPKHPQAAPRRRKHRPARRQAPAARGTRRAEAPAAEPGCRSGRRRPRVTLPALGESVTEGTVTRWLKSVGDTVEVDEPLLEVSTDKVDTEIPSPVAGTLQEIRVNEDETAEVGSVLAVIGSGAPPRQPRPPPLPQPRPPQQEAPRSTGRGTGTRRRPRAGSPRRPPRRTAAPAPAAAPGTRPPRRLPPARRSPATSPPWSASWPTSRASTSPR